MKPQNRERRERGLPPVHRPAKYHKHVADEYEALGNARVAAELRRHLLGHSARWRAVATGNPVAENA